jgi:hypothetical protein
MREFHSSAAPWAGERFAAVGFANGRAQRSTEATAAPVARPGGRWPDAAARQGSLWEMHDALFAARGRVEDPHLWTRAERLGLDAALGGRQTLGRGA